MDDLFSPDPALNLLPCDGVVNDYGRILTEEAASHFYHMLMRSVPWKHDEAVMFGRHIVTARKMAWFGDEDFSLHLFEDHPPGHTMDSGTEDAEGEDRSSRWREV